MKQIATALVKAQKAFGPALKSSTNPHFKSRYADLAACVEAVIAGLNDNGIALIQKCYDCDNGVMVETMFVHESGEMLECGILHVPASKQDLNYFFRVRTVKKDNKIVSTNYGKIDRDIDFDIINSDTALLFFTYYLNPTPNDRNMEFDPKRNLLKGLKDAETVTNP